MKHTEDIVKSVFLLIIVLTFVVLQSCRSSRPATVTSDDIPYYQPDELDENRRGD